MPLLLLALISLTAFAGNHRFRVHPNSRLDVRSMAGASDGMVWLAAADGLWRFDGFHYHRIPTFPFPSATHVVALGDNSLWVGGPDGLARMDYAGKFHILRRDRVLGLAPGWGEVFLRTPAGLFRINATGQNTKTLEPLGAEHLLPDGEGGLWYAAGDIAYHLKRGHTRAEQVSQFPEGLALKNRHFARAKDGALWFSDGEFIISESGQIHRDTPFGGPQGALAMLPGPRALWLLPRSLQTLDRATTHRWEYLPSVPSAMPSRGGFEDARGRLWADLPGTGLMEAIPDPSWQSWPSARFRGKSIVQILRERGSMIAATFRSGEGQLWRLHQDRWLPLGSVLRDFDHLLPLKEGGFLASTGAGSFEHLDANGRIVQTIEHPEGEKERFREIVQDGAGVIWVAHEQTLFRLDRNPTGRFSLHPVRLPGIPEEYKAKAVDLELDNQGVVWVGYNAGIARGRGNNWEKVVTTKSVNRVLSFALAGPATDPGADIWVLYGVEGGLARLRRPSGSSSWDVEELSPDRGFTRQESAFIKRDRRGWIWHGTSNGVRVSDGLHIGKQDWLRLSANEGLPSGQLNKYGFLEDEDGSVWLAGVDGVAHLRPSPSWFAAPRESLRITCVESGGKVASLGFTLPELFEAGSGSLRVDAGLPTSPDFREHPVLYRLRPGLDQWRVADGGTVEFSHLGERAYTLEFAWTGADGPSVQYAFRIGPVPWWHRALRWNAVALALGLLLRVVWNQLWMRRLRYRIEKFVRIRLLGWQARPVPTEPIEEGALQGRYRLIKKLADGGSARVYEAWDETRQRKVALKIYNHRAAQFAWVRNRWAHEVAALRTIDHPGVLQLLDSWVDPSGNPCLVMPLINGTSLRTVMEQGYIEGSRAANLIRRLGESLDEIHSRGVIHRDVKPENIIIRWEDSVELPVLIDFGNAGILGSRETQGKTQILTGTVDYMAPEQLMYHFSAASDMYSFAITTLELLTCKKLADLGGYEPGEPFRRQLVAALSEGGRSNAAPLAAEFEPVLQPDPRRRPTGAAEWSRRVAAFL